MKKYKITLLKQILVLIQPIITYGLLMLWYKYYIGGAFFHDMVFVSIVLILFTFDLLPAIVLHIQYLIKNRGSVLTINSIDKTILYQSGEIDLNKKFSEISSIEYHAGYGGGSWYSFSAYRYFKIIFNDKSEIIITCLMIPNIKAEFNNLFQIEFINKISLLPLL
jgi:hypothetical protein